MSGSYLEWNQARVEQSGGFMLLVEPVPGGPSEAELRQLQRVLRLFFLAAIDGRRFTTAFSDRDLPPVSLALMVTASRTLYQVMRGRPESLFLHVVARLLREKDAPPISRCPECANLFIRIRRQLYCSRRCVDRANKRAQRAETKKRASRGRHGKKR